MTRAVTPPLGRTAAHTSPPHARPAAEIEAELGSGPEGLTAEEAARRLVEFGPNAIEAERPTPWWAILLHQFRDPLIYILGIAAVVTLALQDVTDTVVILVVVALNAVIGFVQEHRANRAILALARLSAPQAEVVRDGSLRQIPGHEVVPGDHVVLASGGRVPADLRLTRVRDLAVDESALTGESVPARKGVEPLPDEPLVPGDRTNMAFAGTVVTRGRARGVVVATGAMTELGRIASAVREMAETATPLQRALERFGRRIGVIVLVLAAVVVGIGLGTGRPAHETFLIAVAMAVSAIPEGLPVVLTVTLAVGVRRMARRNAIVRTLPAVETLGATTVIGSDKTGTLTRNEMTVRAIWAGGRSFEVTGAGYDLQGTITQGGAPIQLEDEPALARTLLAGVLATEADPLSVEEGRPHGDPTEIALLVAAIKAGLRPNAERRRHAELDLLPFEPDQRFMASLDRLPEGGVRIHMKGAPEVVLERCERMLTADGEAPLDRAAVAAAAREMGAEGLRVLATADRGVTAERLDSPALAGGFTLTGLQGMDDPVRPEAVDAVAAARGAGIRVLMLTGDHVETARAVGRRLGLGGDDGRAVDGSALATMDDAELDRVLGEVDLYARVAPEHKLRIVERFKARGEVVAVTGDGVNDAPALRAAHLGVAMGISGTDVAREAADIVLTDDNFATITAAVEEGRVVFSNIRKVTFFLLSTAVGEVMAILAALLAGWPMPFVAAQILWINLATNGLQDIALAFEPGEPGLLARRPRPLGEDVMTRRLLPRLAGVGAVLAAGSLATFGWVLHDTGDLVLARTAAVTQMVVFQFFHVVNSRSLDRSILAIPPFSNPFLFACFVAAALAHLAALHLAPLQALFRMVPLYPVQWAVILAVGSAVVIGGELDKWRNRRLRRPIG